MARAKAFYAKALELGEAELLEWSREGAESWYVLPMAQPDQQGQPVPTGYLFVFLAKDPLFVPSRTGTSLMLPCIDIEKALACVIQAGGEVLVGKTPYLFPPNTRPADLEAYYAFFLDSEGNRVGFLEYSALAPETQSSETMNAHHPSIINLSEASFTSEVLEASQLVVADFWAAWCGPCKALAPVLDTLAEEMAGKVKFVKVNAEKEAELLRQYGVRSLPTLVFFKEGREVDRLTGNQPAAVIREKISRWL